MRNYRAFITGPDGHFKGAEVLTADDDRAALDLAQKLVGRWGVEVWLLDRRVGILPPTEPD